MAVAADDQGDAIRGAAKLDLIGGKSVAPTELEGVNEIQDNITAFLSQVRGDANLNQRFQQHWQAREGSPILIMAKELGFEFRAEDLQDILGDELSDDELNAVSGGVYHSDVWSQSQIPVAIFVTFDEDNDNLTP